MLRDRFQPNDFSTTGHYWDTFDHQETEISARWIVRFLQERNKGWDDFTVGEIRTFYKTKRESGGKPDDGFTFNYLVEGTHNHMTAQSFPFGEPRPNDAVIHLSGASHHPDTVCTITDGFIRKLVAGNEGRNLKVAQPLTAS
jgi:hypothetical protein